MAVPTLPAEQIKDLGLDVVEKIMAPIKAEVTRIDNAVNHLAQLQKEKYAIDNSPAQHFSNGANIPGETLRRIAQTGITVQIANQYDALKVMIADFRAKYGTNP